VYTCLVKEVPNSFNFLCPVRRQGKEGALSIFKFIRFRPPTIVDVVMIAIGLAGLYLAWLQVTGGGAPGR
ncbi:MAG: hypothetical protein WBV79_09545, partial [Rhodomicrobium sp.]